MGQKKAPSASSSSKAKPKPKAKATNFKRVQKSIKQTAKQLRQKAEERSRRNKKTLRAHKVDPNDMFQQVEDMLARFKDREPPHQPVLDQLRVGSDCSGMGCDLLALKCLGLGHKEVVTKFWSEIEPKKADLYRHVSKFSWLEVPRCFDEDMTKRNHEELPDVDLYTSGFPCQPMSALGKRKGVTDVRGLVGFHCLQVVILKRPIINVFENVKGLLQKKHQKFTNLFKKVLKTCGYKVFMKVLNTKDFGIPQSRPRVYIVAIHESAYRHKFKWPKPHKEFDKKNLGLIIERSEIGDEILNIENYEKKYGKEIWKKAYILDVNSSSRFQSARCHVAPCLTYSRLAVNPPGYYIPALKRRINLLECGRLQGMPDNLMRSLMVHQDHKQIGAALGDGMSINVLSKVFLSIFISIGWMAECHRTGAGPHHKWMDGWEWTPWNL